MFFKKDKGYIVLINNFSLIIKKISKIKVIFLGQVIIVNNNNFFLILYIKIIK